VGRENVMAGIACGTRGHAAPNWLNCANVVKGTEGAYKQLW